MRTEETHTTYTDVPVAEDVHRSSTVSYAPSGAGMIERLIIWIFGIIQLLIILRIVLLLFAARDANPIVNLIYSITDLLVAPFRGIFGMNEIAAGATALDVAALVALVGWTILELVILGLVRIFRPARYA